MLKHCRTISSDISVDSDADAPSLDPCSAKNLTAFVRLLRCLDKNFDQLGTQRRRQGRRSEASSNLDMRWRTSGEKGCMG